MALMVVVVFSGSISSCARMHHFELAISKSLATSAVALCSTWCYKLIHNRTYTHMYICKYGPPVVSFYRIKLSIALTIFCITVLSKLFIFFLLLLSYPTPLP